MVGDSDSSPPTASDSHVCHKPAQQGLMLNWKRVHTHTHTNSDCASWCKNLIFGKLRPQTSNVVVRFCDLRLQAGWISHLWVLLVHTLHLFQSIAKREVLFWKCEHWLRKFLSCATLLISRRALRRAVIFLLTFSPLVLRLMEIFGYLVNLSLQPLLPLLWRKVREVFCRRQLHKHKDCTQ